MKLIALIGKSKSGKDTIGQMLVEQNPKGVTIAFADKLKEVVCDLFDLTHDDVYTEEGKNRITEHPCYKCPACGSIDAHLEAPTQVVCKGCTAVGAPDAFASFWTVRMILQHVGTEGYRRVCDTIWVRHVLKKVKAQYADRAFVAITDCRFKSEAEQVWRAEGEVWRVRRPETDRVAQGIAKHRSETEMDTMPDTLFQCVINNDSTLDNLRIKANERLERFLAART
jgi:hypothetical protein